MFHRAGSEIDLLSDLKGRTVAIGGVGSGTRTFVEPILARIGIDRQNTRILDQGGKSSADALIRGEIDAAFYIASAESPVIRALVQNRKLELMTFKRAEAYTRHYLYMSKVLLPRGMVNFEDDVPANDKTLLAAAATMVIHDQLHPALRTPATAGNERNSRPGRTVLSVPANFRPPNTSTSRSPTRPSAISRTDHRCWIVTCPTGSPT